jgi:sugar O-acyltransferase (sialic acid O-acetyltransferase NeuD family)
MKKNKELLLFGLGETAELAYHYFTQDSSYTVVAFTAGKEYVHDQSFLGLPVINFEEIAGHFPPDKCKMFIAMASSNLNRDRTRFYCQAKQLGYKMASYISSHAYIGFNSDIGENCFILENNVIQPFVKIGNNVTLWSGNHIGHRSIIHDNCFLTSHVVVSGFCEIGENCFIGVNTSIADKVTIGADCLIGLGSIISKNIAPNTVYKMKYAQKQPFGAKQFYNIVD